MKVPRPEATPTNFLFAQVRLKNKSIFHVPVVRPQQERVGIAAIGLAAEKSLCLWLSWYIVGEFATILFS